MAHDTFEEDMELANGNQRNKPNMAERTLLIVVAQRDKYQIALERIVAFPERAFDIARDALNI